MRAASVLALAATVVLIAPSSGCLDSGGETTRVYGEDACSLRMSWTQPGIHDRLAEQGRLEAPEPALGFEPAGTELPDGVELRSVEWHPDVNASLPLEFGLGVHRYSTEVVLLEARVPEDAEDRTRGLAAAFVENVTERDAEAVDRTVDEWLAQADRSTVKASPDGTHTNVSVYQLPIEGPFPLAELVANLSLERQPAGADLASLTLTSETWRLWGTTALAEAVASVRGTEVEVEANPFDDVAVEAPNGDDEATPSVDVVNETFEELDLPEPAPETWAFEDPCAAVEIQRPAGTDGG